MKGLSIARRTEVFNKTCGRCFYCGIQVIDARLGNNNSSRDWLALSQANLFTVDHATPLARGGKRRDQKNLLPSCVSCNSAKGGMTYNEFRLIRGLRNSDLNTPFYCEQNNTRSRDWIICHSLDYEKSIFFANFTYTRKRWKHERTDATERHNKITALPLAA